MKLKETITYKTKIKTKTGLHIGGNKDTLEIGGMDQPVIKNHEGLPYIPGSSLKGKMRSLVEISIGQYSDGGELHQFGEDCGNGCMICRAFGIAGNPEKKVAKSIGPTRLIVRDIFLADNDKEKFQQQMEQGKTPFEEKTEVKINRESGTAAGSGPRPLQRVPAGTLFEGEILFKVFDVGDEGSRDIEIAENLFENENGLKMLIENDYLGGQGSRGSGEVEIIFEKQE